MRLLRHKQNRKTLAFFKVAHGLVPPYKVLVDGNFVLQGLKMEQPAHECLPRLLDGNKVFLHVTDCVLAELEGLGPAYAHVVAAARSTLAVIRCRHKHGHTEDMDAGACLSKLVGPKNDSKYIVATQDAGLRQALRDVPGVPLALFSQNVLVLEGPSKASKEAWVNKEQGKQALSKEEEVAVKRAKLEAAGVDPEVAKALAAGRAKLGGEGGSGSAKKKKAVKKGPSQPNPLSMKKKKAKPGGAGAPPQQPRAQAEDDEGIVGAERAAKRRRRRGGGGAGGDDDNSGPAYVAGGGSKSSSSSSSGPGGAWHDPVFVAEGSRKRRREDDGSH